MVLYLFVWRFSPAGRKSPDKWWNIRAARKPYVYRFRPQGENDTQN
jgi:hypothetical protein